MDKYDTEIITKTLLFSIGIVIILLAVNFFIFIRGFLFSIVSLIIIGITIILMFFTIYENNSELFFNIEIENMDKDISMHYHSMITNLMIGFSATIGIIITLVWSSKGEIWRTNNIWLLIFFFFYFNLVMYIVFLKRLQKQIAKKNKKR